MVHFIKTLPHNSRTSLTGFFILADRLQILCFHHDDREFLRCFQVCQWYQQCRPRDIRVHLTGKCDRGAGWGDWLYCLFLCLKSGKWGREIMLERKLLCYNLGQNCWDNSNWLAILIVIIIISTVLPLSPISMLFWLWKTSLMHRQTFKTTLSEGGGEGKHFCDYDCVSIPGKEEISTRFWFVSTSFVRGCNFTGRLFNWSPTKDWQQEWQTGMSTMQLR